MYLEEWEEYQSILREMKTTALVQKRYKKQGAQALAQLDKGGQPNTAPYTKARPPRGKSGLGPMEEEVSVVPEIKEDLNRDIWNDSGKLKPEIADKLVRIAEDFYKKLELPAPILNITLTGSMANYNWTDKSDLDVHIVIDYSAVDEDIELVRKYLMEAKINWNRSHEIMIKGHEVEIYVQNIGEPHHSTGVYSILDEEWVIEPLPVDFEVSEDAVRQKTDGLRETIKMIEKLQKEGKHEEAYGDSDRLKEKLRKFRQGGLESGGEFSVENLVFKALRNGGELETLSNLKRESYDAIMSIREAKGKK